MAQTRNLHTKIPALNQPAPFGTVLGVTDGNVNVYSCDYATLNKWNVLLLRESMQMTFNGHYTGFKYQCVELARRYLLANLGMTFDSIRMAYEIFELECVTRPEDGKLFALDRHKNGSSVRPVKGSMLLWNPKGDFERTGHVAIVTRCSDSEVDIVEQNVHDSVWPDGQTYSRRLQAQSSDDESAFHIKCDLPGSEILGWCTVDKDKEYVKPPLTVKKSNCPIM